MINLKNISNIIGLVWPSIITCQICYQFFVIKNIFHIKNIIHIKLYTIHYHYIYFLSCILKKSEVHTGWIVLTSAKCSVSSPNMGEKWKKFLRMSSILDCHSLCAIWSSSSNSTGFSSCHRFMKKSSKSPWWRLTGMCSRLLKALIVLGYFSESTSRYRSMCRRLLYYESSNSAWIQSFTELLHNTNNYTWSLKSFFCYRNGKRGNHRLHLPSLFSFR